MTRRMALALISGLLFVVVPDLASPIDNGNIAAGTEIGEGTAATGSRGVEKARSDKGSRIVAIGDVHGAFDELVAILKTTALIDEDRRWIGGAAILVQTGDFLDRGYRIREVMDLLMALQEQAPGHGGQVIVLLGNHEGMNLSGWFKDVHPKAYESFADQGSEQRQKEAWRAYRRLLWDRARLLGRRRPALNAEAETDWRNQHPLGFVEFHQAMGPKGTYGKWLRRLPATVRLGNVIFLHGGISPLLKSATTKKINQQLAEDIDAFDRCRESLIDRNLALPFFSLMEMMQAAHDELANLKAVLRDQRRGATVREKSFLRDLEHLISTGGGQLFDPEGPLWFRGFASWSEEEAAEQVPRLLASHGAEHFVTAHTPQSGGRITARLDGKIFLIDTGMLSSVYTGGRASALEIRDGTFTAIYRDRRVPLLGEVVKVAED